MATQMLALGRTTGSTWGATFKNARQIYTAIVRPAIVFGSPIWHTPSVDGGLTNMTKKLGIIQNVGLRKVTGAYKATPIRELQVEAAIPPIQIYLDSMIFSHLNTEKMPGETSVKDKRWQEIQKICERTRRKMHVRARVVTPGIAKRKWRETWAGGPLKAFTDPIIRLQGTSTPSLPCVLRDSPEVIKERTEDFWIRWDPGSAGRSSPQIPNWPQDSAEATRKSSQSSKLGASSDADKLQWFPSLPEQKTGSWNRVRHVRVRYREGDSKACCGPLSLVRGEGGATQGSPGDDRL